MATGYCLYQEGAAQDGKTYAGTANIKTLQGLAIAAFATPELAEYFASVFNVKGRVVSVSELGSKDLPLRPKPPVTVPKLMLLIPTKGVLSAWAEDRGGFDTKPHIFPFEPVLP